MGRHTALLSAQPAIAEGIVGGTWIKTPSGLLPAEELQAGDVVTTHDGRARVMAVDAFEFEMGIWRAYPDGLVLAPGEAPFYLLPDQPVLFADRSVRSGDLAGLAGIIQAMPVDAITLVSIALDRPAAVIADHLCLPCPSICGARMEAPLNRAAGRRLARRILGRPAPGRYYRA